MKRLISDDDRLRFDPFDGDRDLAIKCRTVKLVTVRKAHPCHCGFWGKPHNIQPGERARYEHALVDGDWGSYYVCLPCVDRWIAELT